MNEQLIGSQEPGSGKRSTEYTELTSFQFSGIVAAIWGGEIEDEGFVWCGVVVWS